MADAPPPRDAAAERPRMNPIGIAMLVVLFGAVLFGAFLCTQRGGTVDGRPGTTGVTAPERLSTDDVQRATPGAPPQAPARTP